jgi:hypothetical protein
MKTLLRILPLSVLFLGLTGCCTSKCVREHFCKLHNKLDACCGHEQSATYLLPPLVQE